MRKIEISMQTAKDIRKILRRCICKSRTKHECEFAKMYYNKMTRVFSCEVCPVKCLSDKLKYEIEKGGRYEEQ